MPDRSGYPRLAASSAGPPAPAPPEGWTARVIAKLRRLRDDGGLTAASACRVAGVERGFYQRHRATIEAPA